MNRFAISDIHGCANTFNLLLKEIKLKKEDHLYLLGDYIDRGPDSKGVIDIIWKLEDKGYNIFPLRGNHEQLLLNAIDNSDKLAKWHINGGEATLQSFQANHPNEIPEAYRNWMNDLPYFYTLEDYILVHAGFKFVMPNPLEEKHSMLWARNWYDQINYNWLQDRIIVHGHTPATSEQMNRQLKQLNKQQAISIDNGCVFRGNKGYGTLIAFDLDRKQLHGIPYSN